MLTLFAQERPARLEEVAALRDGLAAALAELRLGIRTVRELISAAGELLNNAVEHGAPPPTRFGVRLSVAQGNLLLTVTDDGGPFANFDAMAAQEPTNPFEDGLAEGGFGLFVVRRLFPDHGYAAGSVGTPNRFWVRHSLSGGRRRVLIVDDDPALRRLLEAYLLANYDVDACDTAAEARRAFASQRPDLIIADIHLPDATGIDLVEALSADSRHRPVPVIFLTAETDDEVRERAIQLGIDDFLAKPVSRTRLLEIAQRALVRADQEHARFIRHMTGELNAALAPDLPARVDGFSCAVRSRSVGSGGGDLVFRLPNPPHHIVIADVMGHGAGAKMLAHAYTAYFQGLTRSLAGIGGPGALLERLAAAVMDDPMLVAPIITAMVLALDADGTVRLASAGHPPALRVMDGAVTAVDAGGPVIGLLKSAIYEEAVFRLRPGERLCLYTDGVLRPGAAGTGSKDLPDAVLDALRHPTNDLSTAAAAAFDAVGPLTDDATIVVIERSVDPQPSAAA